MVQILRDVARDRERPEGESTASEVGYGPTGFASGPTQPRRGGYAAGSVEPSEETAQPAMASLNSAVSTGSGAPAVPTASGHASDRPPPGQTLKVRILDSQSNVIAVTSVTLETALGSPFVVQDWYALNHNMFAALNLQKLALVIILTLIIIVAIVNMVSALTMMVIDKTREIAILKSMGSTAPGIARVFLVLGLAIGGVGTVLGLGIGLSTCFVMSAYGYHLDPKVYLIDRLPIEVQYVEVLAVAGITLIISLVATLFPSQSAAALTPVDGLRYD